MAEQEYSCFTCIHGEKVWGFQHTVYCRWLNDCYKDTKATECREYVNKKVFEELSNGSARMEIEEP